MYLEQSKAVSVGVPVDLGRYFVSVFNEQIRYDLVDSMVAKLVGHVRAKDVTFEESRWNVGTYNYMIT